MQTNQVSQSPSTAISSLYVAKCLGAFLVVLGHIPMGSLRDWLYPLTLGAVPIFFMISGYFLYSEDERKSAQRAWRSIKKILPIFLLVTLFYWVLILPNHGNTITTWEQVLHFLIYGQLTTVHLWFLMAMLQALVVFALLFRLRLGRFLWLFIPLIVTPLIGAKYSFLVTGGEIRELYYVFNSVCYAFPFMALGYTMKKHETRLNRAPWSWLLVGSLAFAIAERPLLISMGYGNGDGPFMGSFLFAISLVAWGITHKRAGRGSFFETIGAKYSGCIYYFHIAVATLVGAIINRVGIPSIYEDAGALIVFLSSLILAYFIIQVQDRLNIHILS